MPSPKQWLTSILLGREYTYNCPSVELIGHCLSVSLEYTNKATTLINWKGGIPTRLEGTRKDYTSCMGGKVQLRNLLSCWRVGTREILCVQVDRVYAL